MRKLRLGEGQGEFLTFMRRDKRFAKHGFELVEGVEDKHGFRLIRHAPGCGRWLGGDQAKGNVRP